MKPSNHTVALPPPSPQLLALMNTGVTDRGDFEVEHWQGNGYQHVTFAKRERQFKGPSFAKAWSNKSDSQAKVLAHETEKAVNLRDQLFAAMVECGCDPKKVKSLAQALYKQGEKGVNLDLLNWKMGTDRLNRQPVDHTFTMRHENFQKAFKANLQRVLNTHPENPYASMGHQVIHILKKFESGLGIPTSPPMRSKYAADTQTTTSTTTSTADANATITTTTATTLITGTVGTTLPARLHAAQSTQGYEDDDLEELERRRMVAFEALAKAMDDARLLKLSEDPPSIEQEKSAWKAVQRVQLELNVLDARIAQARQAQLSVPPEKPAGAE